jgi:hypothetical protein
LIPPKIGIAQIVKYLGIFYPQIKDFLILLDSLIEITRLVACIPFWKRAVADSMSACASERKNRMVINPKIAILPRLWRDFQFFIESLRFALTLAG